jgi:hypothetical protein
MVRPRRSRGAVVTEGLSRIKVILEVEVEGVFAAVDLSCREGAVRTGSAVEKCEPSALSSRQGKCFPGSKILNRNRSLGGSSISKRNWLIVRCATKTKSPTSWSEKKFSLVPIVTSSDLLNCTQCTVSLFRHLPTNSRLENASISDNFFKSIPVTGA